MGKVIIRGQLVRQQAIQIVKDGGTLEEAAQATGFKTNYIRQLCNQQGIEWRKYSNSKDRFKKVVTLAKEGCSVSEIAEALSISNSCVSNKLKQAGIKANQKKKESVLDHESMRAYFREGHTAKEVAERFETSANYAKQICRGIRTGNQYTNGLFDREANAIRYINERTPWFEYAGNYTGIDGYVDLKCKTCGTVTHKSFVSVRHGKATCVECTKRKREADKKRKQIQRERKRYAEQLERERNKWMRLSPIQISFIPCPCCGDYFVPTNGHQMYCSIECANRINNARSKDKRIKRMRHVVVDRNITLERLYKRDNGKCYICGGTCDWNDCYKREDGTFIANNNYPSIDHVVPLHKGGEHSWDNVKLACRGCNSIKRDAIIPSLSRK